MFQTFEDLLKPGSVIATSVGVIDTFQLGILCLCDLLNYYDSDSCLFNFKTWVFYFAICHRCACIRSFLCIPFSDISQEDNLCYMASKCESQEIYKAGCLGHEYDFLERKECLNRVLVKQLQGYKQGNQDPNKTATGI